MACDRCEADPQPKNFGSPRQCAFDEAGNFTPKNWNCVTLNLLSGSEDDYHVVVAGGEDETLEACYSGHFGGWIILTRYKHRGCTSSAIHVGDFFPPRPVTLELVEKFIARQEPVEDWDKFERRDDRAHGDAPLPRLNDHCEEGNTNASIHPHRSGSDLTALSAKWRGKDCRSVVGETVITTQADRCIAALCADELDAALKAQGEATGTPWQPQALASAMRKMLPPALLAEVIAHLDPVTPFVEFLRTYEPAPPIESRAPHDQE